MAVVRSGEQTISGVACVTGDRVLLTAQASSVDNGVYVVDTGPWVRAQDFDGVRDVVKGTMTLAGTSNPAAWQFWHVTSPSGDVVPGTSAMSFATGYYSEPESFAGGTNYAVRTLGHEAETQATIDSFTGVDPTGATNSATAISSAIALAAAIGVKKLRFPGTYLAQGVITLASNMEYEFAPGGSIVAATTDAVMFLPDGASNIKIVGMKMTGSCSRCIGMNPSSGVTDLVITGCDLSASKVGGSGYQAAIHLGSASRVWIHGNYLHGNGRGTVNLIPGDNADIFVSSGASTDIFITNNVIASTAVSFNILNTGASNFNVVGNTISGAAATDGVASKGYAVCSYKGGAAVLKRTMVVGNNMRDTVGMAVYLNETDNSVVLGNTIENCCTNFDDTSVPAGGVSVNVCSSVLVSGNSIKSCEKAGVVVAGTTDCTIVDNFDIASIDGPGVYIRGSEVRLKVVRNTIKGSKHGVLGIATLDGVEVSGNNVSGSVAGFMGIALAGTTNRSLIQGNRCTGNARYGIFVGTGTKNSIIGNQCFDNSTDAANNYDGILNQSTHTKIAGNVCGNSAATGQQYGISSTGDYCTVSDNDCTRNQNSGMSLSGASVQRGGNRLSNSATPGATQGSATLVAGTVTVNTDEVRTGDFILLMCPTAGGTQGIVRVSAITNGTSFTLTSSQGADTSTYTWRIEH